MTGSFMRLLLTLVTLAALASPSLGSDFLYVRIPEAHRDLWIGLEQREVWLSGECERTLPIDVDHTGTHLEARFAERFPLLLDGAHAEIEQTLYLIVDGTEGKLSLRSGPPSEPLELRVAVEFHESKTTPGCS